MLFLAVLLLAFAGISNAQSSPLACFTGNMYGRDIVIAMVVLVMIMILALVYMASKFLGPEWTTWTRAEYPPMMVSLGKANLEAWVKTESYQLVVSCFIAASMILIADTACWISWDLSSDAGAGGANAFTIAINFVDIHYEKTLDAIQNLYFIRLWLDYLSSYYVMMATNPQFLVQRFPGLSSIAQNLNTLVTIFSILAGNLMVQRIILQTIEQIGFTLVLPVGLVLRIIPFTRDAGSFLIAVAFGFYIVFPLTYVMANQVLSALPDEDPPRVLTPIGALPGFPMPGPFSFVVLSTLYGPIGIFFDSIKNLDFIMAATFFPALNITITITFIRSLTKALIHHTG